MSNLANQSEQNCCIEIAELLIDQGFKVLPMHGIFEQSKHCTCSKGSKCNSSGKHPKLNGGVYSATGNKAELKQNFQGPTNLGIACGSGSDCVVLDIDPRNGGDESLVKLLAVAGWQGELKTLKEITGGGGVHYYFIYPSGIKLPKNNPAYPGIDLLSDGSVCVCAPSTHKSGGKYQFQLETTVPDTHWDLRSRLSIFPPTVLRAWADVPRNSVAKPSTTGPIPQGGRNNELFHRARGLLMTKSTPEQTLERILELNSSLCVPPLDESEVRDLVASAGKYLYQDALQARLNYHREKKWNPLLMEDHTLDQTERSSVPSSKAPEVLYRKAEDIARRLGTSTSAALQVAISALSGVIGRRCQIFPKPDFKVIPNLSCALIGGPSTQKSPILKEMLQPLMTIEQLLLDQNKEKLKEYNKERFTKELKISEFKSELKKATDEKKDAIRAEIAELKVWLEGKFTPQRILVNDVTIEKLLELMQANPYGLSMVWDELSGLFKLFEREGRESERQMILSLISGDIGQMQDRVGRGHVYAEHVLLTIIGGIQPEVLREIMPKTLLKGSGEDGMLQRFPLLAFIDQPKNYTLVLDGRNETVDQKYNHLFQTVLSLPAEIY